MSPGERCSSKYQQHDRISRFARMFSDNVFFPVDLSVGG